MKRIFIVVIASCILAPILSSATPEFEEVDIKTISGALCDVGAAGQDSQRTACRNEANRILNRNFYDIALQLCVNHSTTTRNTVHCFADASEKIDLLGPPYEKGFSEKIYACENLEYTKQATQNEVVACQRKHFESGLAQINKAKKSSVQKNIAPDSRAAKPAAKGARTVKSAR